MKMKNEEDRDYLIDLLIEALQFELEDIMLDSLDNRNQYDTDYGKTLEEEGELDFDIK